MIYGHGKMTIHELARVSHFFEDEMVVLADAIKHLQITKKKED